MKDSSYKQFLLRKSLLSSCIGVDIQTISCKRGCFFHILIESVVILRFAIQKLVNLGIVIFISFYIPLLLMGSHVRSIRCSVLRFSFSRQWQKLFPTLQSISAKCWRHILADLNYLKAFYPIWEFHMAMSYIILIISIAHFKSIKSDYLVDMQDNTNILNCRYPFYANIEVELFLSKQDFSNEELSAISEFIISSK